jgi:Winged helix DNA-binding domain
MPDLQRLDLARWRFRTHQLVDPTAIDPAAVVGRFLGVQAENQSQAMWAVASRTTAPDHDRISTLLDDGTLVRTHVLRPTWHFVLAEDLGWLGDFCRPRLLPLIERQLVQSGIDRTACDAAIAAITEAVSVRARTRRELAIDLAESGAAVDGRQLMLLAAVAEMTEAICSGPLSDGTHTYAGFSDRVPSPRRLDRDSARAELALRYITGHGPATDRDLAYWATMPLRDARAGLADMAEHLGTVEVDGTTYWYRGDPPAPLPAVAAANLLQILDEYYRGYQHTRALLDIGGHHQTGREASTGMTLIDSQIVGGMTRTIDTDTVVFEIHPIRTLTSNEEAIIDAAAARYGAFLGRTATVTITR